MSRCRGLTFVEMIVVIAIFTGLSASLLTALLVGRTSQVSSEAYIQVQEETRRLFDDVVRELHEAGNVNNNVSIPTANPVQRLDFQIVRGYDHVDCGGAGTGLCMGTDDAAFPVGWIHYNLDAVTDPTNPRFMRCVTAGRLDAMPANYVGCRVLANRVNATLANSSFTYDHINRTVTVRLQTTVTSSQLPGGTMGTTPTPLMTLVRLRNAP